MQQLLTIAHVLGGMLSVFALSFVVPIAWSIAAGETTHRTFALVGASVFAGGLLVYAGTWRFRRELQPRDGCLIGVLGWAAAAAVAAVPLRLLMPYLSLTDAYFECIAAITTTGATVLSDIEALPQSVNVWRHTVQWVGGMGIIVMAVAVLPLLGVGGMQLFRAEAAGPIKEGKLAPRIVQTAKYLWLVYVALTAACLLALRAAGLDWYEALCHAFSAVSLGGFSTRDAGVAAFDSPAIEGVLAVFMMLAVLNFTTHYTALRRRSLAVYAADSELRASWGLILVSCVLVAAWLVAEGTYDGYGAAWRYAAFNVISIATSAGYASVDYDRWPAAVPIVMLFLGTVASCAGSTGGGIKMIRTLVLVKQAGRELLRLVHPRAVTPMSVSGVVVEPRIVTAVMGYMLLYGATVLALSVALMATGLDPVSAFGGVIASVNNIGPGLARLGPSTTYASLSDLQTWVLTVAMLAGRLELLTFFALFLPAFWRK